MPHPFPLNRTRAVVALAMAMPQLVFAQAAPATSEPITKVVITGSNIRHIEGESATPVQVIKRDEINRLGVSSVKELLDTLTAATGSLSDIGGSNSFAGGASSASLRNLGKQSTLILLNSRRVAPYALADYSEVFTNLDALPLDAVERIEVLRSGGSAVYGSDAVAGVINIITRSNYQGVSARASREQSVKASELHTTTASITGGFGDLASDRYNVLANVEYFKRGGAVWRDLVDQVNPAYASKFATMRDGSGLMFGNRGTPSTFSYPGNLIGQGPLLGCSTLNAAGLCVYDRYSRFEVQPAAERANVLVSGKFKVSDTVDGFSEVLFSDTRTTYTSAHSTYDSTAGDSVWGNPSTGQSRVFSYGYIPSTHPLNTSGTDLPLRYRFIDDGGYRKSDSTQYRVLAGLKGTWDKFDWESALGIMGSKSTDRSRGTISVAGFTEVVGTPGWNDDGTIKDPLFFNRGYKIGQVNSADVLGKLFPENGYDGKMTQYFWDGKVSGEIGQMDGRAVQMAVGADLRHEKFRITPSANLLAGDIVSNGAASADASRTNESLFAELEAPVLSNLNLTGAARVDKFPGFKAHFSPKVAARFEASKQVLLRATYETGFRAPNLTESATSSKFAFDNGVVDPRRCPQALALASDLRSQSDALPDTDPNKSLLAARADSVEGRECAAGVPSAVRNNPNLKPEVSRSATAGIVIEPARGYNVSFDYWHIQRKDEIGLKSTDDLLAAESAQEAGVITRTALSADPTFTAAEQAQYGVTAGALSGTNGKFENVSKTKTSGIDIGAAAKVNTGIGTLDLSLAATYLLDLRYYSPTRNGGSYGDNLAGRYGYSKTVANLAANLQTGDFNNGLRLVYNSPTSMNGDYYDDAYTISGCADRGWTASECRIASYVRTDYNFSYTGIPKLKLTAIVGNLFNRRPPIDLKAFNQGGGGVIPQSTDDVRGRVLRLTAEYKF